MRHYRFPSSIVFEVWGEDSRRYLNARLSNDISKLAVSHILFAAALTPQGKVEGLFTVCNLEPQRFLLICDGGDRKTVREALTRFIVADRVSVSDLSDNYTLLHLLDDPLYFTKSAFGVSELAPLRLYTDTTSNVATHFYLKQRTNSNGLDVLMPREEQPHTKSKFTGLLGSEISATDFLLLRLAAGKPTFPNEVNCDTILSEVGIAETLSSSKGCYVGQEVIERIRSRGKPPRVLQRLLVPGNVPIESDMPILGGAGANSQVGKVLSSAFDPNTNQTICFALVRNEFPAGELLINGLKAKIFD